jgi:hypothetical protein
MIEVVLGVAVYLSIMALVIAYQLFRSMTTQGEDAR